MILPAIRLAHNRIGAVGAKAIAKALEKNRAVAELESVPRNLFFETNLYPTHESISHCLVSPRTFTLFSLSSNNISDKGAAAFGTALEFDHGITKLE